MKDSTFNELKEVQDMLYFLNKHYKSGNLIYPVVIAKSTKSDIKNVYKVLEECCNQGKVKKYFDIYCSHCCRFIGERYSNFVSIPDTTFCSHCDSEITNCSNQSSTMYKML